MHWKWSYSKQFLVQHLKKNERVDRNLVCVLRYEKEWEIKIESDFQISN